MTSDRPLTRVQLDAVNKLSSHIEASPGHALIEYHHGDFKHDPIDVLRDYFDGFLYWANWRSPELAFRFPHRALPGNLLADYDFDEFVTFTKHDEATKLLVELREATDQFGDTSEFQARFRTWIMSHQHRPAFLKCLQDQKFPVPQA